MTPSVRTLVVRYKIFWKYSATKIVLYVFLLICSFTSIPYVPDQASGGPCSIQPCPTCAATTANYSCGGDFGRISVYK